MLGAAPPACTARHAPVLQDMWSLHCGKVPPRCHSLSGLRKGRDVSMSTSVQVLDVMLSAPRVPAVSLGCPRKGIMWHARCGQPNPTRSAVLSRCRAGGCRIVTPATPNPGLGLGWICPFNPQCTGARAALCYKKGSKQNRNETRLLRCAGSRLTRRPILRGTGDTGPVPLQMVHRVSLPSPHM